MDIENKLVKEIINIQVDDVFLQEVDIRFFQEKYRNNIIFNYDEAIKLLNERIYNYEDSDLYWSDLVAYQTANINNLKYSIENKDRLSFKRKFNYLFGVLEKRASYLQNEKNNFTYNELVANLLADLESIIYSRALQGLDNQFYFALSQIYMAGGFPCGWSKASWSANIFTGELPSEGSFIVFIPEKFEAIFK